jgi:hypothetical protein
MLMAERAMLFRPTGRDMRALIKVKLHAASGGCVCHLHKQAAASTASSFKSLEFCIRICGQPLNLTQHPDLPNGKAHCCPRHFIPGDFSTHEAVECVDVNAGYCAAGLAFEFRCVHDEIADARAPASLTIPLAVPVALREPLTPLLRDVAAACCALTLPAYEDAQRAAELKAIVDAKMMQIDRERPALTGDLYTHDCLAMSLFRQQGVVSLEKGKLKSAGKRIAPDLQKIAPTHGYLFKRAR